MKKSDYCPKEPWLAVVLSSFIAGIGQIYAGRKWRGSILIFTVAALICFSIWSILSPKCDILVMAGVYVAFLIVWIWNLFDAHKCTRTANSDNFETERKQVKDAWLALFLSDLIPGLGQIYLKRWLLGIGFVIIAGILLIVGFKYPPLFVGLWAFFSMFVCYHAYISAPIRREPSKRMIFIIAIVILCSFLLNSYNRHLLRVHVVEAFITPVNSMKPTLVPGDRFLVRKNKKNIPKRDDVIVFKSPDDPGTPWIKRVVALPGETIEIKNEILYVDGQKVQHPALQNIEYPPRDYVGMEGEPYKVPENHIFVIGDNSANSEDSRAFGAIPLSDVIGKAYKIYWPFGRRGPIK
ncbi:MAG: signal peptidase I [Sedimentisphaerales bacterium]